MKLNSNCVIVEYYCIFNVMVIEYCSVLSIVSPSYVNDVIENNTVIMSTSFYVFIYIYILYYIVLCIYSKV